MIEDDLDLVFHLGDYIYEYEGREGRVRMHTGDEIELLDDYRNRYALYRSDPDLQAAHAAFPWVVTWDDHEVDNNYANDVSEEEGLPAELLLRRRAAAYQAYYEHMPLRRASLPNGPDLQLYRAFDWGDLASFHVLDTRQFRTDQPCGDRRGAACDGIFDPAATLLGETQERWLMDGLDGSTARWNVIPQQIMMARIDFTPGAGESYAMDVWAGYEVARRRLMEFLATRQPANPVVLTGDIHSNWVTDLKVDYGDPAAPGGRHRVRPARPISSSGGRRRYARHHRRAARREPVDPVLQRPARLRALRPHRRAVPRRLPGSGVRDAARQPHLDAGVVPRRGRAARRPAAVGGPVHPTRRKPTEAK